MTEDDKKRTLTPEEEDLSRMVESADMPVLLFGANGRTVLANERATRLLGYSIDELRDLRSIQLFHPEEHDKVRDRTRLTISGKILFPSFLTRLVAKNGAETSVQLISMPIKWRGEWVFLNFVRDLTEERKLEQELHAAQRLQSVGTLAGGVAHDFNNLLMSISGNVSLMLFDIDNTHPHYQSLMEIEEKVRSGARLANELLGYARQGKHEEELIDLRDLAKRTLSTFARTRKDIVIHPVRDDDKAYTVMADRESIERVLLNVCINAGEAMPRGGELFLTIDHTDRPGLDVESAETTGPFVHLALTDSGEGMDEEGLLHAFDPFYTTRERRRGTGLGLSSAYGVVKRHGGFIEIHSPAEKGVTVDIYLPVAGQTPTESSLEPPQIKDKKAMILLVEDEESIIKLGERMLNRLGYTVLSAKSGEEAIAIYKKCADQIDLVILDMIMPGMNGQETWRELKVINPDVTVLVASGYSESQADEILKDERNGFMQKPFNMATLSSKLEAMLSGVGPQ